MVNPSPNPQAVPAPTDAAADGPGSRIAPKITEEQLLEPLVVLSADTALIADLKRIAAPREVRTVDTDVTLSQALREVPAAVTVLDSSCVTRAPLPRLTARLKLQFPEIAVLVLGESQDHKVLADQLARDTIYGFLQKPVVPERLQQVLACAWLRQTAGAKGWGGAPPDDRYRLLRLGRYQLLALAAAAILAAVVGGALALRALVHGLEPDPQAITAALPVESPADRLLSRADAAVAAGAFENAADLYRKAQQVAPGEPRVRQGLEFFMRKLLAASQTQLLDQHTERAQVLAKLAAAMEPDDPRVMQLVTQISALQNHAAEAAASATAVDRLEAPLRHAHELMRLGRLLDPPRDNARTALERARQIAADDPRVDQLQKDLLETMLAAAGRAAAAGHPEEVLRYMGPLQELGARPLEIARMESLTEARPNPHLERLTADFNARLQQGKLLEPAGDSAQFYLAQLVKNDPDSPASQVARVAFKQGLIAEAQSAAARQNYLGARRWLAEARDAGADAASIARVETGLPRLPAPEQPTLLLIHQVEPDYPRAALAQHIDGSVDVQYTVYPDGTTGELEIISATPSGIFNEAAINAVRQWRYRPPVLKDGTPTQVRAQVKVSFTP